MKKGFEAEKVFETEIVKRVSAAFTWRQTKRISVQKCSENITKSIRRVPQIRIRK